VNEKFSSLNKDTVTHTDPDTSGNKRFEVKFNAQKQATVEIALDEIDFRLYRIRVDIQLFHENGTTPIVRDATKSGFDNATILSISQITYNSGKEGEIFAYPFSRPIPEFGIKLDHFSTTTDNWFLEEIGVTPEKSPKRKVTIIMQLETKAEAKVIIKLIADKIAIEPVEAQGDQIAKLTIMPNQANLNADPTKPLTIKPKGKVIFGTQWIRAGVESTLGASNFDVQINVNPKGTNTSNQLKQSDIQVFRVAIGQGVPILQLMNTPKEDNNRIIIADKFDNPTSRDAVSFQPKGPFRLGYLIHSIAPFDVEAKIDKFYVKSPQNSVS